MDDATYRKMRANVLKVREYFTMEGILKQIFGFMQTPQDPSASKISCIVKPISYSGKTSKDGAPRVPGVSIVGPGSNQMECCIPSTINETMLRCARERNCIS
jgi:hypothetical protein